MILLPLLSDLSADQNGWTADSDNAAVGGIVAHAGGGFSAD
jgi:hypothetical protein